MKKKKGCVTTNPIQSRAKSTNCLPKTALRSAQRSGSFREFCVVLCIYHNKASGFLAIKQHMYSRDENYRLILNTSLLPIYKSVQKKENSSNPYVALKPTPMPKEKLNTCSNFLKKLAQQCSRSAYSKLHNTGSSHSTSTGAQCTTG